MTQMQFNKLAPKEQVQKAIHSLLTDQGFKITEIDFNKPWGGYMRIAEEHAEKFIKDYFKGTPVHYIHGLLMTPKLLAVAPGVRLSWQYHHRRNEIWRVIFGPMGVMTNLSDEQTAPKTYQTDDVIKIPHGQRHRAIGLENWAVWAEIWEHTDREHPSEEVDIVRVQDDFLRT